jgi:hypothetical protein
MMVENESYLRSIEPLFLEVSLAGEGNDLAVPAHAGVDRFHAEQLKLTGTPSDLAPEPLATGGPITTLPPSSDADLPEPPVSPSGRSPVM